MDVVAAPPKSRRSTHASTRQYVVCGALQLLVFVAYASVAGVVFSVGYDWIAAGSGVVDVYLRAVAVGGLSFVGMCVLPIVVKWTLIGRWTRRGDPDLERTVLPILARPHADQGEPDAAFHRLATLPPLPQGAGREDWPGRCDPHPAPADLHRPADHRRGHGDPQGLLPHLLSGRGGSDPHRSGHDRHRRVRRPGGGARHRHIAGRRSSARPWLRPLPGAGGSRRRAAPGNPGRAAHRSRPPGSRAGARRRSQGGHLRRHGTGAPCWRSTFRWRSAGHSCWPPTCRRSGRSSGRRRPTSRPGRFSATP